MSYNHPDLYYQLYHKYAIRSILDSLLGPGQRKCISGKVQITLNHIFKYSGDILSKEEIEYSTKNQFKNKKVSIIGFYLNGEKIGEFDSYYQASNITNLDPYKISLCCRGLQKRVKNTYWQFNNLSTPIANPTPIS